MTYRGGVNGHGTRIRCRIRCVTYDDCINNLEFSLLAFLEIQGLTSMQLQRLKVFGKLFRHIARFPRLSCMWDWEESGGRDLTLRQAISQLDLFFHRTSVMVVDLSKRL